MIKYKITKTLPSNTEQANIKKWCKDHDVNYKMFMNKAYRYKDKGKNGFTVENSVGVIYFVEVV